MIKKFKTLPQWLRWGIVSFFSLLVWFFVFGFHIFLLLQEIFKESVFIFKWYYYMWVLWPTLTTLGMARESHYSSVFGDILAVIVGLVLCFLFACSISLIVWSIRWLIRQIIKLFSKSQEKND